MADESQPSDGPQKKKNRRPGRRRRNKKCVILDLTKRRKTKKQVEPEPQPAPLKVKKRKFETTSQYMRRLDRLVAIAKVEAIMETKISGLREETGVEERGRAKVQAHKSSTPARTTKKRGAQIGVKAKK